MNIRPTRLKLLALAAIVSFNGAAWAEHLHIVLEPRQIYPVSSKTEGAWATCQMCLGKIRYERTWKRNHDDGSWIETTREHPTHCRKCKGKIKELEKYRAENARLSLKLEKKALKESIRAKKAILDRP